MKRTYYLFNPGILARKDNTLKFTPVNKDGVEQKPRYLPVEGVDELFVFGELKTNSPLLNFLGKNQISVHFYDYYENYTGSFMPRDHLLSGKTLVQQVQHYTNNRKRIVIAKKFIEAAAFNMLKNLKYYENRGKDTGYLISEIETLAEQIPEINDVETLMGAEGNIRMRYYEGFNIILNDFEMGGRSKKPPRNEVNALISFGNMMCYSQCLRAIHQTQLNPTVSYLHEPGVRRYSLALDLAEIFKPILVDRTIFKVLNKKEITSADFEEKANRIFMREKGKKAFVQAFETRLGETFKHRKLNRNVSYKYLIRLECYKLIKHIMGIEEYKPFKMYW